MDFKDDIEIGERFEWSSNKPFPSRLPKTSPPPHAKTPLSLRARLGSRCAHPPEIPAAGCAHGSRSVPFAPAGDFASRTALMPSFGCARTMVGIFSPFA